MTEWQLLECGHYAPAKPRPAQESGQRRLAAWRLFLPYRPAVDWPERDRAKDPRLRCAVCERERRVVRRA